MQIYRLISFAAVLGAAFALSACDPSTPSQIQTGKIRVKEQMVTVTLDATPDPARVKVLARNILRDSEGGVTFTAPYLVGNAAGRMAAERSLVAYKKAFEGQGVTNISVATVPVADRQYARNIIMDYRSLVAVPAKDCIRIPGYQGADNAEGLSRYNFGCETQAAISKMVAPSDLLGKGGGQDNDSRRSGTIIEPYRSGTPNEPIQGMQASQIGGSGR